MVAWTGPVAHLFFHALVIHPELAFTHDSIGQGFRDWYVTVGEFRSILDQLYANGWTLVDIHRAVDGDVRVPEGRKPLVPMVDDWSRQLKPFFDVAIVEDTAARS